MSKNRFRYFKRSPEIIPLVVLMQVRFPLSLQDVESCLKCAGEKRFTAKSGSAAVRRLNDCTEAALRDTEIDLWSQAGPFPSSDNSMQMADFG